MRVRQLFNTISVRTALRRSGSFVLSDIRLSSVAELASVVGGPHLFRQQNLLAATPQTAPHHDHEVCQMLVGTRGSYTDVHYDFYGADAYLQLMEGVKVWYIAPPEKQTAFRQVFEGKNVNVSKFTGEMTATLLDANVHAIVQHAGDVVFVPGGWLHCVKNLTATVAFGGSFLRAWKLPFTIDYLRTTQRELADTYVNWRGVFRTVQTGEWGVTQQELQEINELYAANTRHLFQHTPSAVATALESVWHLALH